MVPIIRTDLIIRTVWSCFDICFKVKKKCRSDLCCLLCEKKFGRKKVGCNIFETST